MKISVFFITSALCVIVSGRAFANAYDIPQNMNADLNGTAGAGTANVSGGGSIAVNPAGLASVKNFESGMTFNLLIGTYRAPANGPYSECATDNYAPLGFFDIASRLNSYLPAGCIILHI